MAKLQDYNIIYLNTYNKIFNYLVNKDKVDDCIKTCLYDEMNKIKNKKELVEFDRVNIGQFNFILIYDDESVVNIVDDLLKVYSVSKIKHSGISENDIINILDSKKVYISFYQYTTNSNIPFDKNNLLNIDTILSDYSYLSGFKYKIITKDNYNF